VVIVPDFLPPATVELCTAEINGLPRYDTKDPYTRAVNINDSEFFSPLMSEVKLKVREFIEDYYSCVAGQEELGTLAEVLSGWKLKLHSDEEDGSGQKLTPNGYPSRDIVTILYFSNHGSDFTGGALGLPNQDLLVLPRAGMLVVFPTTDEYEHHVTEVEFGERLFMPAFWHVLERFDSTRYV